MFESKIYDTKKTGESDTRQTDRRARFTSSADEVEPESTEAIKRREAVATFAAMCRRSRQWRFENADLMIPVVTRLPGWRQSRVVLQILEEGRFV
ncbi:hypothetical protein PQQ51_14995 [Paraburkholderia xenovorans]|uniref:hypothetical protein n=1 Tax=Paraburkholderia xenovorans TaxID=36873 RepID=UPI0038B7059E